MNTPNGDAKFLRAYEADFQDAPLDQVTQGFQNFYDGQNELLETCKEFAYQPDATMRARTKEAASNLVTKFQDVADEIIGGEITDEKVQHLHIFMLNTDTNWVDSIREIEFSKKIFSYTSKALLKSLKSRQEVSDTADEFVGRIVEDFADDLKGDIRAFSKKVLKRRLAAFANTLIISFTPVDTKPRPEDSSSSLLAFAIEPRLSEIHTPDFIPNATITFSGKAATYGYVQIEHTPLEGEKPRHTRNRLQQQLFKDFSQALNPFDELDLQIMGDAWPDDTKAE